MNLDAFTLDELHQLSRFAAVDGQYVLAERIGVHIDSRETLRNLLLDYVEAVDSGFPVH